MTLFDTREHYKKDEFYKQCCLRKPTLSGYKTTTTFLPEKFCIIGKVIKLKDNNGEWEDGWVVEAVGCAKFNSNYINRASREHLKHRNRTDI